MAIRVLPNHTVAIDQVDYFQGDFFTRITGLTISDLTLVAWFNNTVINWPLVSGSGINDELVKAGSIYFHELADPGYYSLRFRPNVVGYWRMVANYDVGAQSVALDYDIKNLGANVSSCGGGLTASFIKP